MSTYVLVDELLIHGASRNLKGKKNPEGLLPPLKSPGLWNQLVLHLR